MYSLSTGESFTIDTYCFGTILPLNGISKYTDRGVQSHHDMRFLRALVNIVTLL